MTIFIRACVLFLRIHNVNTQHKYVSVSHPRAAKLSCSCAYWGPIELVGWVAPRAGLDSGTCEVPTELFLRIRVFWGVTFLWASADVSKRRSTFIFRGQVFQVEDMHFLRNVRKHPTTHHHINKRHESMSVPRTEHPIFCRPAHILVTKRSELSQRRCELVWALYQLVTRYA